MKGDEQMFRMHVKGNQPGQRGVYLYNEDLIIMKQLLLHQSMRSTSIHELFISTNRRRSKTAISNRLRKLIDAGILVQMKEMRSGNFLTYHQRLGKKGIDVLVELGVIGEEEGRRAFKAIHNIGFPSDHTIATSVIANQIFMQCLQNKQLPKISQSRGSNHDAFKHTASDPTASVIPDWVFENSDTYVCIETDTGTQREHVIKKKYSQYKKKAKLLNAVGKKLVVVFSVVDNTALSNFSDNRTKRVAAIKEIFPPFQEWCDYEENFVVAGLNFYVVSAERTPPLVEEILGFIKPLSKLEYNQYSSEWSDYAEKSVGDYYSIESIDKNMAFGSRRDKLFDCSELITLTSKRPQLEYRTIALVIGEEGSVMNYQLIRTNILRVTTMNDSKRFPKASLLVCYNRRIELEEEVLGLPTTCELLQTDIETWEDASREGGKAVSMPDVMVTISKFKREWRKFYD